MLNLQLPFIWSMTTGNEISLFIPYIDDAWAWHLVSAHYRLRLVMWDVSSSYTVSQLQQYPLKPDWGTVMSLGLRLSASLRFTSNETFIVLFRNGRNQMQTMAWPFKAAGLTEIWMYMECHSACVRRATEKHSWQTSCRGLLAAESHKSDKIVKAKAVNAEVVGGWKLAVAISEQFLLIILVGVKPFPLRICPP